MIIGNLNELTRYLGLSKNIDTAINYVASNDLLNLEVGKYEIDGKNVYLMRQSYLCKDICECAAENHNNYIDLQIVLRGCEGFGYAHISNNSLKVISSYNPEKDVTKYQCQDEFIVPLSDNMYAMVFPEDVHKPTIKFDDRVVEKVVVKIKIDKKL